MTENQNQILQELQDILVSWSEQSPVESVPPVEKPGLENLPGDQKTGQLRSRLSKLLRSEPEQIPTIYAALQPLLAQLPVSFLDSLGETSLDALRRHADALDESALDFIEEALLRSGKQGRWSWLAILASIQSSACLDLFVRELLESEVTDQQQVLQAFAPLMQKPGFDPDWLFPDLFQGLNQAALAPVIVDLANYCFRQDLCDEHPASSRKAELQGLLDQLATRMLDVESDPTSWAHSAEQISKMISDSVALIVSLCDSMALLDNQEAIPAIEKVGQLRHRRVRAEAAFALAKLGVEAGIEELLKLVDEPVSRLRVLQYAEELGISDRIDEKYRTEEANAESELALWLSQPNQMGVPPSSIELKDRRTIYWPSYDDPVDCFLFRFEYRLGENVFSNLAIVGPLVHAFLADLQAVELEDAYAAFAGWQVEHEEIRELDLDSLTSHRKTDLFRLERRLNDYAAEQIEIRLMGLFFGEVFAVARCQVGGKDCLALVDANEIRTFELAAERPLDESILFAIYVGKKLISAFNE